MRRSTRTPFVIVVALTAMVTTLLLSTFYAWLDADLERMRKASLDRQYKQGVADGRALQCAEPRKVKP